jgi:hypothetical protein
VDLDSLKYTPPWQWPEEAGEILVKILRNSRSAESDRIIAADLAGDLVVMNDTIADLLLSIVGNRAEPEQLRAKAATSLGPVLEQTDMEGFDDDFAEPPISEDLFHQIQETLRETYDDKGVPKEVRRRVLEASVRAPQDWHPDAIRAADSSGDDEWKLTAVFCMRWVRGFDERILEMLESPNPDIQYEAVCAAGNWELHAAWPHVAALIASEATEKNLRLAAIEAAGKMRLPEVKPVLAELTQSDDEEIAEAASEALSMAEMGDDESDDDEDDDEP